MKIIFIGRNYSDHAREMNAPVPEKPVFFLKPDTSLLKAPEKFYLPEFTNDLHYECELVYRIDKPGKHISEKFARNYYSSVSLGIDFTARDLQQECKEKGLPWEIAKAFENSAPLSDRFLSLKDTDPLLPFHLLKNGEKVQEGNTEQQIFPIDRIIAYVSQFFTLKTGDLIYTGTPAGVGPVSLGDRLEGFIGSEKMFDFTIS